MRAVEALVIDFFLFNVCLQLTLILQGVALTGRNHTGKQWSVGRRPPTRQAGGRPARRQRYRRQTTTTDTSDRY